jgi:hypothetical protein
LVGAQPADRRRRELHAGDDSAPLDRHLDEYPRPDPDERVRKLADGIAQTQKKEIAEMRAPIKDPDIKR